ncbi:MAG: hypothetical protein COW19_09490 [Zetaproteobacteria bacterium CG12_big_fil_rev_8_21_14_0_65_55_1124]|nr:MAG: hypothetical protein AUJ58_06520 [Zetaproteobacteria bacterium CG1_02_55_237]PIS18949.1 MAG: hypothetical protein COT53_08350 [Zetaproteobacteria bacterium CG08_land_8_20_14_0_20_55_17]PIW42160.1 MAG: hypothetical protein COW19_09490 [Zetaproteobacteria bacterium CG12_big_fil_rev_8_21_14_0_65_55_1124]PIY54358.1 MAG: hypothetical protein COZ01_00755 [Zetaproteobacteria bacterium CG_4_10_14_0_8_um_filter_55_43]PIZ38902.1 MAG: hypothetical protein COY36_04775 [Zetaproteobacteria bacterium 
MNSPVVVIGIGEIGSVFARGFMRLGYPIVPVTRDMNLAVVAEEVQEPEAVIVAVAEKDLHATLADLPDVWRKHLVLLQNELLPRDWQQHGLADPTVISVWFEKKKGMDSKVVIASPAYGEFASLLKDALGSLDIPVCELADEDELLFELVLKNLYILTTNIAGLESGGNVRQLWLEHNDLACSVAGDVLDIQEYLTGQELDRTALIEGMLRAFDGDPEHGCMGRSAPARLARALSIADDAGLKVPTLRRINKAKKT